MRILHRHAHLFIPLYVKTLIKNKINQGH